MKVASIIKLVIGCLTMCMPGLMPSSSAQEISPNSTAIIIDKIATLENVRDPKCYATANRLEDFMYGTPLHEDARILKFDIQKELVRYVRQRAAQNAKASARDTIFKEDILTAANLISTINKLETGDFTINISKAEVKINARDYRQYASVAYAYRVLLSVEQDLMFASDQTALPMSPEAVAQLNEFLNVMTLCALQVADQFARNEDLSEVSEEIMKKSWLELFYQELDPPIFNASDKEISIPVGVTNNKIIREIIRQKVHAYEQYNELNTKVFLRNIQVYFAKQKWPVDKMQSDQLKNYYLESLIAFANELLTQAEIISKQREESTMRWRDVNEALSQFMPFSVNQFEDVTFFPLALQHAITIESYDLDAYRDSGIHWKVLEFALDDAGDQLMVLDPQAAELVVEGIAQLGVLVLRLSGQSSKQLDHPHLMLQDMESALVQIQSIIDHYHEWASVENESKILSAAGETATTSNTIFIEKSKEIGIDFYHKSSDWLSRLIRSYLIKSDENLARLAIPPAFGGSGIAAEDINNDNLIDLLILGGEGNQLLLNTGSGSFIEITDQVKINHWNDDLNSFGEPRQPIIVDFDNDGLQDIFITYVNDMHQMFKNLGGGQFENVSHISRLDGRNKVAGPATCFDYDNDGLLDLYIGYFGNYLDGILPTLSRNNQNGMANKFYRNLGDFKFQEFDYAADSATDNGWTQALGHSDINHDGRQDLIVGNDFGVNRYYLNTTDSGFVEMSRIWKVDKPSYTMNVGIGDLNRDAFPDFYISNIVIMQKDEKYVAPNETTTMRFDPEKMANVRTVEANDLFLSKAGKNGLEAFELSTNVGRGFSSTGWSWDADFFDFDNDGDEDLYCLNGMNDFSVYSTENEYYADQTKSGEVTYAQSNREQNVFFVNENGKLVNRAKELGADLLSNARSATYLDFDQDGDLDIAINNYHDRASFLENKQENTNHWIKLKLIGDPAQGVNRDAIGANIVVNTKSIQGIWREVHSTNGYLSVHPKMQYIGLADSEEADIIVTWPNGRVVELKELPANRVFELQYPDNLVIRY
jgi:hypothetical protein